jgi:hypothetical protein
MDDDTALNRILDRIDASESCHFKLTKVIPGSWIATFQPDLETDGYLRAIRGAGVSCPDALVDLARQL